MSQNAISLQIYPNPNNGYFTVSLFTETPAEVVFNFYDAQGARRLKQPKTLHVGRNNIQMDQRQWEDGMYFLEMQKSGVRVAVARFFISRRR
ncbi:MAG: T9SS type A sorting domain-containing protein [Ferruginibacter sp.]|nr:T9SS type A sorting domain-containing protein [Ferruginibacter sp.]